MNNPQAILIRILEIIGYTENKEKFAAEFLQNVSLQSLLNLFNTLPQDQKDKIQQQIISAGNNPSAVQEVLKTYFTDLQMKEAVESSAKNAMQEYIKAIDNTLSEEQRTSLANYFSQISSTPAPAVV